MATRTYKKKKKETVELIMVKPHTGGRGKQAYGSEKELDDTIMAYFQYCYFKENGKARVTAFIPNKAGLCLFLNISRETYSQYRKKYPDTIKKADAFIENAWIQRLQTNAPTGAIFYLKNAFKEVYKDKHEVKTSGVTEHLHSFDESQLQRIAARVFHGDSPGTE